MLITIGLLLAVLGAALLVDAGGIGSFAIRRITSRKLGDLAPGYAAGRGGFRVYAVLILSLGVALAGLGVAAGLPLAGLALLLVGAALFAGASVVAIRGEVRTYRALPPGGGRP